MQLQAMPRRDGEHVPGPGLAIEAWREEEVAEPVELVADVDAAGLDVHRGIRSLIQAAPAALGRDGEVGLADEEVTAQPRSLHQRRAVLAHRVGRRAAGRARLACPGADVADRHVYRVAETDNREVAVAHVQPTSGR